MIASFTGHRPDKFGGYDERSPRIIEVKRRLRAAIDWLESNEQMNGYICGGALGIDTWAADIVLEMGRPLILALPFEGFQDRWPSSSQSRLARHRERASHVFVVCPSFSMAAYQRRNEWMVDRSQFVISAWDGSPGGTANCLGYAEWCSHIQSIFNVLDECWALDYVEV
jgi:uncharacterized phage-like protein YoqJ